MANRVYLHCTNFQTLPKPEEWDSFFEQSGVEYEAPARIPVFWLSLFASADVKLAEVDYGDADFEEECADEDSDEPRRYAYLICDRVSGVEQLRARAKMLEAALDDEQFALYEDWMARIASEPYRNVLVRTEELDCMDEEGQFEARLRAALQLLEEGGVDGVLQMNEAIRDITGIWSDDLHEYDSFELVGSANSIPDWPEPLVRRHRLPTVTVAPRGRSVAPSTKPWWAFWR